MVTKTKKSKLLAVVLAVAVMVVYVPTFAFATGDTTAEKEATVMNSSDGTIDVTMRFFNADGDFVDFTTYSAPFVKNGDKLDVKINEDTDLYSLADSELKVVKGFSATTDSQSDVTKESTFVDETGIYSIPSDCKDAGTVITVNVPTTNALYKKFLSQFSDTPLRVQDGEATTTVDAEKGKGATAKAGSVPVSKGDQFLVYHNAIRISQFYYTSDSEIYDWREKYFGDKDCRDDAGLVYGYTLGTHTTDNTLDGTGQTPIVKSALGDTDISKEEKKDLNEWLGDTLFYDEDVSTAKADYALTAGGSNVADHSWDYSKMEWKTYIHNPKCLGVEKTKVLLKGYCAGDGGNGGGKPQIPDDTKLILTYKGTKTINSKKHFVFSIVCGKLVGDHGSEYQDFAGYFAVPMSDTSGDLEIEKKSSDPDATNDNSNYSLKGAKFGLYQNDTYVKGTVKYTDKDGKASWEGLEAGTYELRELTAPKGFQIANAKNVTITAGNTTTTTVTDKPKTMKISLTKQSTEPTIVAGNCKYSLDGATYGVYTDKDCKTTPVDKMTTVSAVAKSKELPYGTYYVKEISPSAGYALDPTVYTAEATEGDAEITEVKVTSKETPKYDPVNIIVNKIDAQTLKPYNQGGAEMDGAEYTVKFTDGKDLNKTWVFAVKNGKIELSDAYKVTGGDALYKQLNGVYVFPLGTVTVQETKVPVGYNIDPKVYSFNITGVGDDTVHEISEYKAPNSPEVVKKGDFEFVKVDPQGKRLANVAFKLTNITDKATGNTSGESHVIVTDENGQFKSTSEWIPHTSNTNGNDSALNEDGTVDSSKLDATAGVWFGMDSEGNEAKTVEDAMGALPYGTYRLDELRCDANEGYTLLKNIQFKVTNIDKRVVDIGTLTDTYINIQTTATDNTTKEHTGMVAKTIKINDVVRYEGLTVGNEYTFYGTLKDKATGKTLQRDGKDVVGETTMVAKTSSGEVTVSFVFSGVDFGGTEVVAFERLHDNEADIDVAIHEDLDDDGQTVHYPDIGTTAKDSETGNNQGTVSKMTTIIDSVKYVGLEVGQEYVVKGELMNPETGEPLRINGEKITAEKTFKPETSEGVVELPFTFDSSALAGKTVVVFEDLYNEGVKVATHSDIKDTKQTVWYPNVETTATDSQTGDHVGTVSKTATIVDAVKYSNLIVGQTYTVKGKLMDKATGKELLINNKPVTAEKTFKAEKPNGTIGLTFKLDSSALEGKSTVVFEDLYNEGKKIGTHSDINDEGQTVHYPKVQTTATVKGSHKVAPSKTTEIVDAVKYSNLIVGQTYTVKGKLMDKATGKELLINNKPVTAEKTFKAEKANGTVNLTFKLDSSTLAGKSIVVYEDLYHNGKKVATHSDINDVAQTVTFDKTPEPTPATTAGKSPQTGDSSMMIIFVLIMLTSASLFVTYRRFNKTK